MPGAALPSGFEALEPFIAYWVLPDSVARSARRQSADMTVIREFYEAILPLADSAARYLQGVRLGEMRPEDERLLKLMLSLAEVAPAVEWYGQPQVYDGFDIRRMTLVRQVSDNAAQE